MLGGELQYGSARARTGSVETARRLRHLLGRAGWILGAMLQCALLAACGGPDERVASCPSGDVVSATPHPLVAQFSTCSVSATSAHIEFGPDTHYGLSTSAQDLTPGKPASFLVAGMKQATTYHMRAVFTAADGTQRYGSDHTFTTDGIPASRLPSIKITVPKGMQPAPGVELASLTKGRRNQFEVVAYDQAGNLIWYYDFDQSLGIAQPVKLLPNGDVLVLLYAAGEGGTLREVDLTGKTVHTLTVPTLNQELAAAHFDLTVYSLNHDFLLLPNGHLLFIGSDFKTLQNVEGHTGPIDVKGNDIIDLDANYEPVWIWKAFDHLDVNRHPMNFPDWTHANSLAYSPADGSLMFSIRHQSWIVKINYADGTGNGDVMWRLGYQGDFTLASNQPSDWFAAQHYASFFSEGTTGKIQVGMFDNGNDRVLEASAAPCGQIGASPCYSRAAIFDVDEDAKTASVDWATKLPYSYWGGVTQQLDNSDVFVCMTTPLDNLAGARAVELTRTSPSKVVWQMDVAGQNSYRTIHLGSLYPGVQW
jgi:arylsulfate sulfotransferase